MTEECKRDRCNRCGKKPPTLMETNFYIKGVLKRGTILCARCQLILGVAAYFAAKEHAPEETLLVEKEAMEENEGLKESLDAIAKESGYVNDNSKK